ncbi:DUF5615 domain-containing protein [Mucilaginibacter galii]
MRLLVDENISWRLKRLLNSWEVLPANEISHTDKITDKAIWQHAKLNKLIILTFDEDFVELQNLYGHPPKIIWLRMGNVNTKDIAIKLLQLQKTIAAFLEDEQYGVIEVY